MTRSIGYKGKILKGVTNILGMAEWSYSGETRNTEPSNLFNYQYHTMTIMILSRAFSGFPIFILEHENNTY